MKADHHYSGTVAGVGAQGHDQPRAAVQPERACRFGVTHTFGRRLEDLGQRCLTHIIHEVLLRLRNSQQATRQAGAKSIAVAMFFRSPSGAP